MSILKTIKSVAWSFVGLRSREGFDQDTKNLNPLHVIAVGLAGTFIFVIALMIFVRWVMSP